jgi:hypothetical protein
MLECFIISPSGERADDVFHRYLAPACQAAGYEPVRSEDDITDRILSNLLTKLSGAPVALAYLGSSPWNINVMIEVGYRLGRFQSLVMLCDEPEQPNTLQLPFNIFNERVVMLPVNAPGQSEQSKIVQIIAERVTDAVKRSPSPVRHSPHAVGVMQVPRDDVTAFDSWQYVEVSGVADGIFGNGSGLAGRTLDDFYEMRKSDMPEFQYKKFMDQQYLLLAGLGNKSKNPKKPPVADVPILFNAGPYSGRAYLPVVATAFAARDVWQFTVIYLDVTGCLKQKKEEDSNETYYVSLMNPNARSLPSLAEPVKREKSNVGVFLCYTRPNRGLVKAVYKKLERIGARPFMDTESIEPGRLWSREIEDAMQSCRAALIFVCENTISSFAGLEITVLTERVRRGSGQLIPVLVSEDNPGILDGTILSNFQRGKLDDLLSETWLKDWWDQLTL